MAQSNSQDNYSCYICNENKIPILRYMGFNKPVKKTFEVILGCSVGDLTPFIIDGDEQNKGHIRHNRSILDIIENFERDYSNLTQCFKAKEEYKIIYLNIKRSIIINDPMGFIINFRYLIEIHQKTTFFSILSEGHDEAEAQKIWNSVQGNTLYKVIMSKMPENKYEETQTFMTWYEDLKESDKDFFKHIIENIKEMKKIYHKLGGQLHFLMGTEDSPKKRWDINDVIENFKNFLDQATQIKEIKDQRYGNGQ